MLSLFIGNKFSWSWRAHFIFNLAPPKFIETPKHINMVAGGSVQFDCRATGSPAPAISWQKDGERLPSDGRHIVLPSGALRVLYLVEQNEGVYECQAINIVGVVAARANLTVESLSKELISNHYCNFYCYNLAIFLWFV